MRKCRAVAMLMCTAAAMLIGSPALADSAQDPDITGQGNKDWGKVTSNLAQLSTEDSDGNGGAMGQHARATKAADINGGFANSGNGFEIQFNVKDAGDNAGRAGVGNATRGAPHNSEPGDGGNGTHAMNNAEAAAVLNPITGEFTTNAGGTAEDVSGELQEGTSAG